MKKRIQGFIAGILTCVTVAGGAVFAQTASQSVEIFYNNIKIFMNGAEVVPKDANGNVVEPFTYNGTTYLPVRAMANAIGKDVVWDGATQSIYLGKTGENQPDNYLDRLQYNDYKEGNSGNDFAVINGTITDYNQNVYTSGLLFCKDGGRTIQDDTDEVNSLIAYPLNSQYRKLKGKIVLPKEHAISTWDKRTNCGTSATDVWFYGDGKLLYKATAVTSSMPFAFDIDVLGVNQLTVKIKCQNSYSYVALTDLALYNK